jgi:beta-glucanase (GH16 family)
MPIDRNQAMRSSRAVWPFLFASVAGLALGCGTSSGGPDEVDGAGGAGGGPAGGMTHDARGGSGGTVNPPRDATGGGADGNAAPDTGFPREGGAAQDASSGQDGAPRSDGGRPGWTLVWADEFNAATGTGADTTKWNLVNKGDGFGNNELQFYTNRAQNAYHDGNGFLVIKAVKEPYMNRQYTSARLESNGKFQRTYGRFESRMQLPRGQGIWPAFWMLGNNIGSAGWPTCGEIDVMENIGREPSIVHGTLHGPGYSGGSPISSAYTLPNGARFADEFHVFAIEWELDVVRWYVDDIQYAVKTPADTPSGARWVYEHPFYLLLNVAVGGNWPGAPDATTVFPQTLTVDYVRVYSR